MMLGQKDGNTFNYKEYPLGKIGYQVDRIRGLGTFFFIISPTLSTLFSGLQFLSHQQTNENSIFIWRSVFKILSFGTVMKTSHGGLYGIPENNGFHP